MALALQVAAVLTALLSAAALLGTRLNRLDALRITAIAVPAVLATVLAAGEVGTTVDRLADGIQRDSRLSSAQAALAGANAARSRSDFLSGASARIPFKATYFVLERSTEPRLWITYQLTPRLPVRSPSQANWLLIYKIPLAQAGRDLPGFSSPIVYAPGLAIARRR